MSEIEIQKNIPVPKKALTHGNTKYPFNEMEVGDSFLIAGSKQNCHSATAGANFRYPTKRFKVLKTDEGYRCWRMA